MICSVFLSMMAESISFVCSLLSGKWYPMSLLAAAPRSASAMACMSTSASLCPSKPCV